jgi:hypothetical protein
MAQGDDGKDIVSFAGMTRNGVFRFYTKAVTIGMIS